MSNKKKEMKKLLQDIRDMTSQRKSPFSGMSEEEVIKHLRKTREKLWEKKLATRMIIG